jgi:hypothetical protein
MSCCGGTPGEPAMTYERWEAKYDEAEERLEYECALALARLGLAKRFR